MSRSPGRPPAKGILGHQPAYAADPLGSLLRWTDAFGDAVRLRFGPQEALLLTSPQAAVEVLDHQADAFRKAPVIRRLAELAIGRSLFAAEGRSWARQRTIIEPALSPERIERHLDQVRAAFDVALHGWPSEGTIDATDEMMAISQRIGAAVLFGAHMSDDEIGRTRAALLITSSDFEDRLNHPLTAFLPQWLPTRSHRRLDRAVRTLDRLADDLIGRARRGEIDGGEVLGLLLAAQGREPWLTDRLVRDNVVTMIVDSRENPGLLLTWALYELARSPEIAERVAGEALAAMSNDEVELGRLSLTSAVARETLRLHPPAYATGRQAIRDCVIEGVRVRRGAIVLVSPFVTQRSRVWFERPDEFDPGRWLDDATASLPPGAHAPFGLGPRRCPGESLALTIVLVGLAMITARHRISAVDAAPIEPLVRLSLRPSREVRLRVGPRG